MPEGAGGVSTNADDVTKGTDVSERSTPFTEDEAYRNTAEKGYRRMVNSLAKILRGYRTAMVVRRSRLPDASDRNLRKTILKDARRNIKNHLGWIEHHRRLIGWKISQATRRAELRVEKLLQETYLEPWRPGWNPAD